MKRRKSRLPVIVDILTNIAIGSQEELSKELAKRGYIVTQATLSRDLKMLRTTKVATDMGGYRYIIAESDPSGVEGAHDSDVIQSALHPAALSVAISGNIVLIKTRNGYASGLAYDIDMLHSDLIEGTIAGADTVFAVVNERASGNDLFALFSTILPPAVIAPVRERFMAHESLK